PAHVIKEMARGLNTGIQVTASTLADHRGEYDWVKDELRSAPYFDSIAFRQNADGDVSVEDVVRILEAINVLEYPGLEGKHPLSSANERSRTVARFLARADQFMALRPILRDVLQLHDTISFEAWDLWRASREGHGRAPMIFNTKLKRPHTF